MKTHVAVICSATQQELCACVDKITEPYSAHIIASYVNGLVCSILVMNLFMRQMFGARARK